MGNADDLEFTALAKLVQVLTPLDQAARDRVLNYAVARFASPPIKGESRPNIVYSEANG